MKKAIKKVSKTKKPKVVIINPVIKNSIEAENRETKPFKVPETK